MADWFLKNVRGSDIAKMLNRSYGVLVDELNFHYFDNNYIMFNAIFEDKNQNVVLCGTIFPDHISCQYNNKFLQRGEFEALKYRVYKWMNSKQYAKSIGTKTLNDFGKIKTSNRRYASLLHKPQKNEPQKFIQKTL